MKWRYAVAALVVVLALVGVRGAMGVPQPGSPSQVYVGHVDMATGLDGRLLVLIDLDTPGQPGDGLVEQAFRLQGAPALTYSGPATVTYIKNRVTLEVRPGAGWVFTVKGWPMSPPDQTLTASQVQGITHLWGNDYHQSPATLFSTLSARTCSSGTTQTFGALASPSSDDGCKNCSTGGPGVSGCSSSCSAGSSCSADCDDESYACCSCGGCGCCSKREADGAAHD